MKNKKRVTALMLAVLMGLGAVGCGQNETLPTQKESDVKVTSESESVSTEVVDEFSWLNTSGSLPLVEEGTEKTLSIAFRMGDDSGNPEDMWAFKFVEDAMNINLDVTKFTNANKSEFISLTFADSDLPDIIIGGGLSTADLMRYGKSEGQIIDLAPYISEELTPNLYNLYKEHPEYLDAVKDSEGHIWSLGYINDPADRGQVPRAFWNFDWLDEAGKEAPTTVDELLEVLRAFKERGEDIIPMGGSYKTHSPGVFLLNAFGYNTTDTKGLSIALRDGKVVLPVADREAYGAYLTLMNTMYTEGLIHPDFYTMDASMTKAVAAEGLNGFYAAAPFTVTSDYNQWWGATPLTGDYNDEPFWPVSDTALSSGQFVISSSCEEVELAMAFADWFFGVTEDERLPVANDGSQVLYNYNLFTSGPYYEQTDILYGVGGFSVDENGTKTYIDYDNNKDSYASKDDYLAKKVQLIGYQVLGLAAPTDKSLDPDVSGYENLADARKDEAVASSTSFSFRIPLEHTVCKYTETGFPGNVYLDADKMEEANNLYIVIKEYAEQESAKFVTGARPLSELDAYFDEMERLGALDYVKIYADYYGASK